MINHSHTAFKELPIVDISLLFSADISDRKKAASVLDQAARDTGFLYLKGHQISSELIDHLIAEVKEYFAQARELKMQNYIGLSKNHTGYVPQGEEVFYSASPEDNEVDLKEGYDIGPESPSLMQNFEENASTLWPKNEQFKKVVSEYYQAMLELSRVLFKGFALALGLPESTFVQNLTQPPSQLRLLHYFDNPNAKASDSGIGAHTDYEFFTILHPTSPGLQVINGEGQWIDVPIMEDCFVVNIGDMMEVFTNGKYVATAHRVQQVKEERYAFPFFSSLDYSTLVKPIPNFLNEEKSSNYEPLICGDHLLAQTIQTFSYLKQRLAAGDISMPDQSKPLMSFGKAL